MENDAAVQRFKEAVVDQPDDIDIDGPPPDAAEPDGAGDEFVVGGDIDEPEGRDAKKRHRKAILEKNKALEEETRELRDRLARLEGAASTMPNVAQIAEIARRAASAADEDEGGDPDMQEFTEANKTLTRLWQDFTRKSTSGRMTAEEEAEFHREAQRLEIKKMAIIARKSTPVQDPQVTEMAQMRSIINARIPDIMGDPKKAAWCRSRFEQLRVEGMSDSFETLDLAAAETRARFGGRGEVSHVDERRRERYTGSPVARGAPEPSQQTYRMTDHDKDMADAMYPSIKDPKARYQKYVNVVGAKILRNRHDR